MKRDHDFIRETLFTAEMWPKGYIGFTETLPFDDKPEKEREYLLKWEHHLRIMQDETLYLSGQYAKKTDTTKERNID